MVSVRDATISLSWRASVGLTPSVARTTAVSGIPRCFNTALRVYVCWSTVVVVWFIAVTTSLMSLIFISSAAGGMGRCVSGCIGLMVNSCLNCCAAKISMNFFSTSTSVSSRSLDIFSLFILTSCGEGRLPQLSSIICWSLRSLASEVSCSLSPIASS